MVFLRFVIRLVVYPYLLIVITRVKGSALTEVASKELAMTPFGHVDLCF